MHRLALGLWLMLLSSREISERKREREKKIYLFDFVFLFSFLKLVPQARHPRAGIGGRGVRVSVASSIGAR